jgi:ribosome-binding factor A
MAKYRSDRINEEMRKEISSIIQNDVRDPRITAMVSVTKVDVTKDLMYAKVYVSLYGNEEAKTETFAAIKSSIGFIRREVGHRIQLRHTPQLLLELDTTIEQGMHINDILQKINRGSSNDNE